MSRVLRHLPDGTPFMGDQESVSWGELAELTHATQVERFNWCLCEEKEYFPYEDCPKEEASK